MRRQSCWSAGLSAWILTYLFALTLYTGAASAADARPDHTSADPASVAHRVALLPLGFEANLGQTDSKVQFLSRGAGYTLFLTGDEQVLRLSKAGRSAVVRLQFAGRQRSIQLHGSEVLQLRSNYFVGRDPKGWQRDVPNFAHVTGASLYEGIDVAYYGKDGRLENDFIVAPGADPSRIALRIRGAEKLKIENGDLVIETSVGPLRLLKPSAFQDGKTIDVAYRALGENLIGFEIGSYDRTRSLTIDPAIDFLTYVSTTANATVSAIATDANGNLYVTGVTQAISFPSTSATGNAAVAGPSDDVYVLKIGTTSKPGDTALLAAFLGGSGAETAAGIAVDAGGNIYLAGGSASSNFPVVTPTQAAFGGSTDAFVAKLTSAGALSYSAFVGAAGAEAAKAMSLAGTNLFITGATTSAGFPTSSSPFQSSRASATDAFVAGVNLNTAAISQAFCNKQPSQDTVTLTLPLGHGFVAGDVVGITGVPLGPSHNTDVNTTAGTSVTLNSVTATTAVYNWNCNAGDDTSTGNASSVIFGKQVYGTYLGGSTGDSVGNGIFAQPDAVNGKDNIFVTGRTAATNFAGKSWATAASGDAFVANLDATASGSAQLTYASNIGGSADEFGNAVAVDAAGNAYITGQTSSSGLCTSACLLQGQATAPDAFVAKFGTTGTLSWFTYLGGNGSDSGNAIRLDERNSTNPLVYVGGSTQSSDSFFATANTDANAIFGSKSGTQSGFVAVINPATPKYEFAAYAGGSGSADSVNGIVLQRSTIPTSGAVVIDTAGSGYTSAPTITVTGGNGSGATATATVAGGGSRQITGITVTGGGSGYTYPPSLVISGGGGSGGAAHLNGLTAVNTFFIAGTTNSSDVATTADSYQSTAAGANTNNGFAARITTSFPQASSNNLLTISAGSPTVQVAYDAAPVNSAPPYASTVHYDYTLTSTGTLSNVVFNWPVPRDASGNLLLTGFTLNPADANCIVATAGITCRYTSLNTTTHPIGIDATAAPAAHVTAPGGVGGNTASVGAKEANIRTATVIVNGVPVSDISVANNGSAGSVAVGNTFTYTVTVTNNGPNAAPAGSITVVDTLPADFTVDTQPSATNWSCTPTATTISCSNSGAALAVGAGNAAALSIVGHFNTNASLGSGSATRTNSASLTIDSTKLIDNATGAGSNGPVTANTTVTRTASLSVATVTDAPLVPPVAGNPTVNLDDTLSYTFTVASASGGGNVSVSGVTFATDLPAGFAVTIAVATPITGTPNTSNCQANGTGCTNLTLAPGDSFTYQVTGKFASSDTTNNALPSGTGTKPFTPSLTADVTPSPTIGTTPTVTVNRSAILTLTNTNQATAQIEPSATTPGGVSYIFTIVSSATSANPAAVVLTPNFPAGFVAKTVGAVYSGNGAAGDASTCSVSGCTAATISPDSTLTVTITGVFPDAAVSDNTVTHLLITSGAAPTLTANIVSSATSSITNNATAFSTDVRRVANLTLTIANSPNPASLGTNVTYTVTLANPAGNATATDVRLPVTLPADFTVNGGGVSVTGISPTLCDTTTAATGCSGAAGPGDSGISIAPGSSLVYSVTGKFLDSATGGVLDPTKVNDTRQANAIVTAAIFNSVPVCDATSCPATTIQRSANVSLTIPAVSTAKLYDNTAATQITYKYQVASSNTSLNTATSIAFTTNLPTGFVVDSFNIPSPTGTVNTSSCSATGCTSAIVAPNSSFELDVVGHYPDDNTVITNATASSKVVNNATAPVVTAAVTPNPTTTCSACGTTPPGITTTVQRSATLTLTVATSAPLVTGTPTLNLGDAVTYTITLTNTSGDTATNVRLPVTLPAGFVVSGGGVNVTGVSTSLCDLTTAATGCAGAAPGPADSTITLAKGASIVYTVTGTFPDGTTAVPATSAFVTRQLTASTTASIVDAVPTGVTDTPATKVQRSATLTLTATNNAPLVSGTPTLNLGQTVTYTVTLSNTSGNTATNVRLPVTLPAGFAPNSGGVNVTGVSTSLCDLTTTATGCAGAAPGPADSTITLAPGNSIVYTIVGTYPDPAGLPAGTQSAPRQITVSATAGIVNTQPTNVKDTAITVQRSANLAITTISPSPTPSPLAGPLILSTTIKNSGPNTATSVTVTYDFAPKTGFVLLTSPAQTTFPGGCSPSGTKIVCTVGTMATSTAIYSVGVTPDPTVLAASAASGNFPVAVTITGGLIDPDTSDNALAISPAVQRQSDIALGTVTDNGPTSLNTCPSCGKVTYTVPVRNFGVDAASGVAVTLSFPTSGYTIDATTPNTFPGSCAQVGAVVTCSVDSPATPGTTYVAVGSSASYAVTMKVDPALTISGGNSSTTFDVTLGIASPYLQDTNTLGGTQNAFLRTTTVARQANLVITASNNSSLNPVPLTDTGNPLKYSVNVANTTGPNDATNVLVTFTMPTGGYSLVSDTFSTHCTPNSGTSATFTCGIGTVANGDNTTATISLSPDPAAIVSGNQATIQPLHITVSSADVNNTNSANADYMTGHTLPVTIARRADLQITSVVDNSAVTPVAMKGPLTFTTTVLNANTVGFGDDATNVTVSHTVPSGYTLVPGGWANYSTCSQVSTTVSCSVPGVLSKGAGGSYSVSVTPGATAVASNASTATPSTTVAVSSTSVYDDGASGAANLAGNNQVVKSSNVARRSDLQVTSFVTNATTLAPVGDAGPLIVTANIRNVATAGFGDDALAVSVTFTLQSSSDNVIGNSGFTSCNPKVGNTVTCTFGPLTVAAGNQTVSLSIDPQDLNAGGSTTPTTGIAVSSAVVWDDSGANNGNPGTNNSASVISAIQSVVHLNVASVTGNPPAGTAVNLGQTVKYTIVLNNASTTGNSATTSPATNATVAVSVPAEYAATASVDPSSGTGWSCDFTPPPVGGITTAACSFSNVATPIASGGSSNLVISGTYPNNTALLATSGGAAIQNIAAIVTGTTSANSDPFIAQNTTTNLQRFVAISANATSAPAVGTPATLGTDVLYTITVNNASSVSAVSTNSARGAFVSVAIPSNFVNGSVDASSSAGWACGSFASSPVVCTQSNAIASGGASTLVIRGQYSDATSGGTATLLTNGVGQRTVTATPGVTFSQQAATVPLSAANATTDIQRLVHLTATASSNPAANSGTFAPLSTTVTYHFAVANATVVNAVAANTAAGVVLNVTLPTDLISPAVTSAGWDCGGFAVNPAPCAFTGSIAPGASAPDLVITGQYSNATSVLPGGGGYAPGTGNRALVAALTSNASFDPTPGSVNTSTDIERFVQLTITQSPPSVNPVGLSATESYTARVTNSSAAGINDATGVVITDSLPSGFNLTSASGTNWSCGGVVSGTVTCTLTGSIAAGATSPDLVITGFYDPTISLAGSGTGTRTNSATVTSALSADQAGTTKTASVDTTIQRNVNMNVSMSVSPNPIGAGGSASNLATYTITIGNNGANDVSGSSNSVNVDFTIPLPNNFTNVTATGTVAASVTCDTTTTPGHVICAYPKQSTTPTIITIKGQFNSATVATSGSASAQATVAVSTHDGLDSDPNNNNASASIIVVDTPAGSNVTPQLNSNGHPITVTFPTVTQAGIVTQAVTNVPPLGFHEPAIDYPTMDYSAALPTYFLIASDAAAPVTYTTPVKVCVAYKTLAGVTFTKQERMRMFDVTGRDITSLLDTANGNVCGLTTNVSPGTFTVREPRNHAPTAKAATQQLFAGKIGTNQFTLDASGTTDPDIGQVCNGSPTPPNAGTLYCGDTLTYTWTGPPGMNGATGGNSYTQTVAPKSDGSLGAPAQVTGSFPLGVSTVTLTVTDQTGATSTSQVTVTVNSFTLSTTNQSAVISAGQSTSFQVVPQDTANQPLQFTGDMNLTCTGKKDSDGSSLASNHVACIVSPTVIQQGQFATALLTTTGPNFSQVRPAKPGTGNRSLALIFALMSPALMGIVVVPGRSKRWKAMLLLVVLVAFVGIQAGCGGSGVAPATQSQPVVTASGTYTVTITGTAAGGVTSTNTFTLTVK